MGSYCTCFIIYIIVFVSYVLISNVSMINLCGRFFGVHHNSAAYGQLRCTFFFLAMKNYHVSKNKQLILKNYCFQFVCKYLPINFICNWIVYTRKKRNYYNRLKLKHTGYIDIWYFYLQTYSTLLLDVWTPKTLWHDVSTFSANAYIYDHVQVQRWSL